MKNTKIIILLLAMLFATACATTRFAVTRLAPANYNVEGVDKVGILSFYPEQPAYTNGAIVITNLIENKLNESAFFESVKKISTYEGRPIESQEMIIPDLLAKIGKSAGVDLLVFGNLDFYDSRTVHEQLRKEKDVPTGRFRTESYVENGVTKTRQIEIIDKQVYYVPTAMRQAKISFRGYGLRPDTAKYAGKSEMADNKVLKAEGDSEISRLPSEQYLMSEMTDRLTHNFVANIVPHEVTEFIKFKSSSSTKEGLKLAREGKWEDAAGFFAGVVQANTSDDVAYYNLGCSYEYLKDYEGARESYKKAMAIKNRPEYNDAWIRVLDIMKQNELLDRQIKSRKKAPPPPSKLKL